MFVEFDNYCLIIFLLSFHTNGILDNAAETMHAGQPQVARFVVSRRATPPRKPLS